MELIVGLGNPGEEYKNTRHNVGFMVVEKLAYAMGSDDWKANKKLDCLILYRSPLAILAEPRTFMNDSGKAVRKLYKYFKLENVAQIIVVHDDLDIKLGEYKIQSGHGPQLHKGVNSIEKEFKSEWFQRVRVGVDNRNPENRIPGEDYVLQKFSDEELSKLDFVIEKIVKDLLEIVKRQ